MRWLRPAIHCQAAGSQTAPDGRDRPLRLPDLEARFTARGRWRERLPTIVDTLEALGRARRVGPRADRWQAG